MSTYYHRDTQSQSHNDRHPISAYESHNFPPSHSIPPAQKLRIGLQFLQFRPFGSPEVRTCTAEPGPQGPTISGLTNLTVPPGVMKISSSREKSDRPPGPLGNVVQSCPHGRFLSAPCLDPPETTAPSIQRLARSRSCNSRYLSTLGLSYPIGPGSPRPSHRKRLLLSGRKLTPAAGPSGRCCVVERPLGGGRGGMVRSYPHLTFPSVACTRRPRHCALDAHSGVSGR